MKRIFFATITVILLTLSLTASPQSAANGPAPQPEFARLKSLAGIWRGHASAGPHMDIGSVRVSIRVTSGGDAIMHEMVPEARSDDPTRGDDDPITMLYIDGDRLMLTHYCDSGKNRPRMTGQLSSDGKTVAFEFLDLSGETKLGHMHRALFTFVDADHHTEDWTFMPPSNTPATAHIDLVRVK